MDEEPPGYQSDRFPEFGRTSDALQSAVPKYATGAHSWYLTSLEILGGQKCALNFWSHFFNLKQSCIQTANGKNLVEADKTFSKL